MVPSVRHYTERRTLGGSMTFRDVILILLVIAVVFLLVLAFD